MLLVVLSLVLMGGLSTNAYSQVTFRAKVHFQNEFVRDTFHENVYLRVVTTGEDGLFIYDNVPMFPEVGVGEEFERYIVVFGADPEAVKWRVTATVDDGMLLDQYMIEDDDNIDFQNVNDLEDVDVFEFTIDPFRE